MCQSNNTSAILSQRLRAFRENAGLTCDAVEEKLIVGPGWVHRIEEGIISPSLDVILALLSIYEKSLTDLVGDLPRGSPQISRSIFAKERECDIDVHFAYAKHDAIYRLPGCNVEQFNEVILLLRNGLARLDRRGVDKNQEKAIKTESVANAFLKAVKLWPAANPSDIWWFVISRAFCDQYNHPAEYSRLDFQQSWKRTGGWALERILEKHYAPPLKRHGINLFIAGAEKKKHLLSTVKTDHRIEPDKVDVLLTVGEEPSEKFIGVVHVKASFAERRTDDVPMSQALVKAGYISPLWTMDCKSSPAKKPDNRGELGATFDGKGSDGRSAKRKDIEDDAYFSACFSYNRNPHPTPASYHEAKAKIHVCDFSNEEDDFVKFIVAERKRVKKAFLI